MSPRSSPRGHAAWWLGAALAPLVLGSGCDAATGAPESAVVRDSAGVSVVEYQALPADLPLWVVSDSARLTLGAVEGDGPDVFGRIPSVAQLGDGTLVVADASAFEVRAFGPDGRHLWSAGRQGEGPGEFRSLSRVGPLPGDSLVAIGGSLASVFDPAGGFARQFRLLPPDGFGGPSVAGSTADGRIVGLATESGGSLASLLAETAPGTSAPYRTSVLPLWYDAGGTQLARAPEPLPGGDFVLTPREGGAYMSMAMNLGRRAQVAAGGRSVAVTTQQTFEVRLHASDGTLRTIVRVLVPPRLPDAAFRARYADDPLEGIPEAQRAGIRRSRAEGPLPDTLPAVGRLLVDGSDRVWVEEWVAPFEGREALWWVFEPDGRAVARASIPAGFVVHQIDSDRAIGTRTGELGVPYAEVREIRRGPE